MRQESGLAVSCTVGCRRSWDPALLWLWHRPAAVTLLDPLAWESPHAAGVALKSKKRKKKKKIGDGPHGSEVRDWTT